MTQGGFEATTRQVRVLVEAQFLPDQSNPDESEYVWAYRVQIENHGVTPVQLVSRTWRITDATGRVLVVQGEGVVGEQPVLGPGEAFEYTSGTPLATPSGFMAGEYHMVAPDTGERFDVSIPAFSLDSPHAHRSLH